MDKRLESNLISAEKVLWEGKAKPFNILEAPYNKSLIVRWSICVVLAIGLPIIYTLMLTSKEQTVNSKISVALAVIPLLVAIMPLFEIIKIQKKLRYVVTNMRAIAYHGDSAFHSLNLDKIKDLRIENMSNGAGTVFIGDACKRPSKKGREIAIYGKRNEANEVTGLVFYSVENPNNIRKHFPAGI